MRVSPGGFATVDGTAGEPGAEVTLGDVLLEQREKNIFLIFEVCIERAAGVAGLGGDIFQARRFKPIARKDSLGGGNQAFARGVRTSLLLRQCGWHVDAGY